MREKLGERREKRTQEAYLAMSVVMASPFEHVAARLSCILDQLDRFFGVIFIFEQQASHAFRGHHPAVRICTRAAGETIEDISC